MKMLAHSLSSSVAILVLTLATNITVHAQKRIGIEDRFANINGVRLHYLIAGKTDPVILVHGYEWSWCPLGKSRRGYDFHQSQSSNIKG